MPSIDELKKIKYILNLRRILNFLLIIIMISYIWSGSIATQFRQYSLYITIILQLAIGLFFYFYKRGKKNRFDFKINGSVLQYVDFDYNQVYYVHFSDIEKIVEKNFKLKIYLKKNSQNSIWSKKRRNVLTINDLIDEMA